ncbi:MAG: ABC transporter permease, partial [Bacteroidota bacterium]
PRRFGGNLTMDIGNTPPKKAIEEAEAIFKEMFPSDPFHYYFLDDYYQSQNLAEKRFGVVFLLFSSLVIIITIMGLMSLSAYTAEQKKKEIGIRKVLGANSASIFRLMFKEYIYLWAIGAVIAIPAVYYLIERWLASFALRIEPGFLFLVLPLATVLIVALITVFVQSEKILHMNPVESIRSE